MQNGKYEDIDSVKGIFSGLGNEKQHERSMGVDIVDDDNSQCKTNE